MEALRPASEVFDPLREKARIRAQELIKRDEQLREPPTRAFIESMERQSLFKNRFVSIYSLMRDGRELAQSLRNVLHLPASERGNALRNAVDPYVQLLDSAERCQLTGLRLQDIWRYFRHTWTNQYTTTPGRSMGFLVRDRAAEFHPVIGIGAVASPVVQIGTRDEWIGWHPKTFLEYVTESPSAELGIWLRKVVDTAIDELYIDDFLDEEVLSIGHIRTPCPTALSNLNEFGRNQRAMHHRMARASDLKRTVRRDGIGRTDAHWLERARTHLYRSKRALALSDMLRARQVLQRCLSSSPTVDEVRALINSRDGQLVVRRVLRKVKADRVGIAMADITVCGAIAPYNELLGGKLVAMLAASPKIVMGYRRKYCTQESEIASSMAGRPVVRPSHLIFLGTTSLYGIGSSQYNRLRMPADRIGGEPGEMLEYLELGKSNAYGTSQFSSRTVDALVELIQQSTNGQRVNSIFGEGVSPKLRKIRDGLDALSLPTDTLLKHGRQRIVYGVPLVRNLREFLLGMDAEPDYIFSLSDPEAVTQNIASWWCERWLAGRIERRDILERVQQHTLVRPVRHGARVPLPPLQSGQTVVFEDSFD